MTLETGLDQRMTQVEGWEGITMRSGQVRATSAHEGCVMHRCTFPSPSVRERPGEKQAEVTGKRRGHSTGPNQPWTLLGCSSLFLRPSRRGENGSQFTPPAPPPQRSSGQAGGVDSAVRDAALLASLLFWLSFANLAWLWGGLFAGASNVCCTRTCTQVRAACSKEGRPARRRAQRASRRRVQVCLQCCL